MDSIAVYLPLGFIVATIILFFYGISENKKYRARREYIRQRKAMLSDESVDERLSKQRQQKADFKEKQRVGRDYLDKLDKAIEPTTAQLKRIEVGLVPPIFRFDDSEDLKDNIRKCREEQFECISAGLATNSFTQWDWMGSRSDGERMVRDYRALLLDAFNAEFEVVRRQMRAKTFDKAVEKIERLVDQLSKLGETTGIQISRRYAILKEDELKYWHAELEHREELKQERKRQRELLRSQQSSGDDSDELSEEIASRDSELIKAQKKAEQLAGAERARLERMIEDIKAEKMRLEEKQSRAMSQAQITRAGYIYVISNEGSFGEGVVKIGMTRRLEPMDRVRELGDASVPFRFDVHALAFVEDAPTLEKTLHDTFNDQRVNTENFRKEFFRVSPEIVKATLEEKGIDTDWYLTAEAKEYHESELMRNAMKQAKRARKECEESALPEAI
ncbi:DUF4041 domain-containing protein [Pseudidiomarina sediminum]|uniref:DUF4041 domain-containing protein n=1 Tax=Pseudidiomarina sediminum TaxID=431675 RepID=UPI001C957D90|nr:DUF4041 domain-containing protein [Pseudidiomarina sediminum]MBY6064820.1 DUF4041 domain-containing protein [Pseudidiomarina sediminum]